MPEKFVVSGVAVTVCRAFGVVRDSGVIGLEVTVPLVFCVLDDGSPVIGSSVAFAI
jgi:hypothetical protein